MTAAGPEAGDAALQDASGDDAALAARIKNRQSASDEIDAGEPQRPGRTHRLDVTDAGVAAKAAENASRRVTAPGSRLGVTGPPDSEEAALSQAVAAATKATAAGPADAARSAPMAGLGGVIARALQRALGGLEEGLGNALKKNIGGDRQAIVSALAAGAAPAAPLGAAPLTATALTAPEAAARSGSVADALASLHIDDAGVAVIRVERTSLGAIEAHVARHGADISVRLRAVEAENQARLLHALPAVRRELDASELVVGRVDVRGDVPADAFGSGASKHQAAADGRDPGEGFDAGEPEPASPRQPGISRLASGAATQTGERRRLLVIA
ncbi:MAG: hypothetical protein R3F39_03495 [Myxococcota bacterium]